MNYRALILLTVCSLTLGFGQTVSTEVSKGRFTVQSEPSGADVFIDSNYVGKTPVKGFELQEGSHSVKVFYPSVFSWNALTKADTVNISAGTSVEKTFELGNLLTVVSNPSGGIVLFQGAELGLTPLYFKTPSRLIGELMVQKEGFDAKKVVLTGQERMPIALRLQSTELNTSLTDVLPSDYGLGASNHWLMYSSVSTMIVSGVLSAYFKDRANRDFDIYLSTKDPGALSSTRRLDRYAAISLAVTQLSFVVLTYLLLSE